MIKHICGPMRSGAVPQIEERGERTQSGCAYGPLRGVGAGLGDATGFDLKTAQWLRPPVRSYPVRAVP